MKKTFLTIMLAAGIGSACAATAAAWEFSSGVPSEQFMTGSGIKLEGWSISSRGQFNGILYGLGDGDGRGPQHFYADGGHVAGFVLPGVCRHYLQLWRDGFSPRPPACLQRGRHVYFQENGRSGQTFTIGQTSLMEDGSTSPCPSVRIPPPGKRISRFS